jgi:hypothetical protein
MYGRYIDCCKKDKKERAYERASVRYTLIIKKANKASIYSPRKEEKKVSVTTYLLD